MILAVSTIIGNIILPPIRFDYEPNKCILVYEYKLNRVETECHGNFAACSYNLSDLCIVILPIIGPGGVSLRDRMLLRQHEYGHCNGWSKDHEK